MPNLWSKSTQKLSEAFRGPRTKDNEFDLKVEELKKVEKGLIDFRNTLKNYEIYTNKILILNKELNQSINLIYNDSFFNKIGFTVVKSHNIIDKQYKEFIIKINNLYKKTNEWLSDFKSIKDLIEKRNSLRKEYDHYEIKLEKIYKIRDEKLNKNEIITAKDHDYYERNERKYQISVEHFTDISSMTYSKIHNFLNSRFEFINPFILSLYNNEKSYFNNIANSFNDIESFERFIKNINSEYKCIKNNYNPYKYIRGGSIIESINNKNEKTSKSRSTTKINKSTQNKVSNNKRNTIVNNNVESKKNYIDKQSVTLNYNLDVSYLYNNIEKRNDENDNKNKIVKESKDDEFDIFNFIENNQTSNNNNNKKDNDFNINEFDFTKEIQYTNKVNKNNLSKYASNSPIKNNDINNLFDLYSPKNTNLNFEKIKTKNTPLNILLQCETLNNDNEELNNSNILPNISQFSDVNNTQYNIIKNNHEVVAFKETIYSKKKDNLNSVDVKENNFYSTAKYISANHNISSNSNELDGDTFNNFNQNIYSNFNQSDTNISKYLSLESNITKNNIYNNFKN